MGLGGGDQKKFFGSSIITRKFVEILVGFYWKLFKINKFLYFDDAHLDMENSFLAPVPKWGLSTYEIFGPPPS